MEALSEQEARRDLALEYVTRCQDMLEGRQHVPADFMRQALGAVETLLRKVEVPHAE